MKTYASQLFDELNRKYWRGRLPRYRVIQRASLPDLGQCDNARRTILLGPHPSPEALRLTLLPTNLVSPNRTRRRSFRRNRGPWSEPGPVPMWHISWNLNVRRTMDSVLRTRERG